jgi:hypothetical protein
LDDSIDIRAIDEEILAESTSRRVSFQDRRQRSAASTRSVTRGSQGSSPSLDAYLSSNDTQRTPCPPLADLPRHSLGLALANCPTRQASGGLGHVLFALLRTWTMCHPKM